MPESGCPVAAALHRIEGRPGIFNEKLVLKGDGLMMRQFQVNSYLFGGNAPYVEELYERYLDNPGSVRRERPTRKLAERLAPQLKVARPPTLMRWPPS